MTIITPTGITGITSITSTGNTLQFQNPSGADVSVSGLNVTSGTNINVTGIVTASGFVGNVTGNATGLSGTPNITVGTIGATSLNASGVVTATTFSGNLNATTLNIGIGASISSPTTNVLALGTNNNEAVRITSRGDFSINNENYNSQTNPATNVNTVVEANENRSGIYWLNFNGDVFRAYIKANWLQGRNWVLAAKFFDCQDMPSGSSLWTNDTFIGDSDFNLYNGKFSKYRSWRYFSFNRLAMQMGNRIAPIMQFSSNQTLYGAFSGGRASNGGGVTASSTDPQIANSATYHGMTNYIGSNFSDVSGQEDIMQSYGLNKWAGSSSNSTSANNAGSLATGFQLTVENSHPNLTGVDSVGFAGAWIGCPLDEGGFTFGNATSNPGADSGFGFGFGAGNNARTGTSGYAEWGKGNECVNLLPAYIWLSID